MWVLFSHKATRSWSRQHSGDRRSPVPERRPTKTTAKSQRQQRSMRANLANQTLKLELIAISSTGCRCCPKARNEVAEPSGNARWLDAQGTEPLATMGEQLLRDEMHLS